MYKLFVIGVADEILSSAGQKLLGTCSHIFATPRLQKILFEPTATIHNISPLQEQLELIKSSLLQGHVGILASGDPLFYGIGKKLLLNFPAEKIVFCPALTSIQRACALFKTSWDDAVVVSLHGRNSTHLPGLILHNKKTILLTDKTNNPGAICKMLLDYLSLIDDPETARAITVMVAEDIGLESQRLFSGSLLETVQETFSPLNVLYIEHRAVPKNPSVIFGLTEDDIIHSRGLITKDEVRAATLHQLNLPESGVVWDVGAGSGSISIEAGRSHPGLTIYAIEHKKEELANIKANIRKFGCYNVVPVFGKAPEILSGLPAPDRIFVGGSSGTLPALTELADNLLPADGRIVINGVIEKTIKEAPLLLSRHKFTVKTTTLSVRRTDCSNKTVNFNPITITTGSR
jgi:precorrin-6Y C5,15-methyltransferase (decarboxylating)